MSGQNRKSILYGFRDYWKYRYLTILFIPAVLYFTIFKYAPLYGIQIAFKDYAFNKGIWGKRLGRASVFQRSFFLWQLQGSPCKHNIDKHL